MIQALPKLFKPRPYIHRAEYMRVLGTDASVQIEAGTLEQVQAAEEVLWAEVDRLSSVLNRFDPQSELCRWQGSPVPLRLSHELSAVLNAARLWHEYTLGALHPGVDCLTALWQKAAQLGTPPTASQLAEVAARLTQPLPSCGKDGLTPPPAYPLNLNALAKGFIVDRATEAAARSPGVQSVLFNVGGDMRHIGLRPMQVQVSDPLSRAENAPAMQMLTLRNAGLASSGHIWRGVEIAGVWYSHLLDPRSGQPVNHLHSGLGMAVMASDCLSADALATALSISPDLSQHHWPETKIIPLNRRITT